MSKKFLVVLITVLCLSLALVGCNAQPAQNPEPTPAQTPEPTPDPEPQAPANDSVTILVAAAASLEYSYRDELIPLFQEKYDWITVEGTYDASGKLQTQIEEGLEADVFMSAAMKQMNALNDAGLIDSDSIVQLLENRIVLIAASGSETAVASFGEIPQAATVALGDPESVPVGQYAQEALTSLGIWDAVTADGKTSFGTNVTEVLNWVAAGSAEVGIVYATDAATTEDVQILAEAPEGSLAQKVIYPVGIVAASQQKEAAQLFVEFLQSPEALAIFAAYGFSPNI